MKNIAIDGLKPCPDRPNCVSSLSPDRGHRVKPLAFECSAAKAHQTLQAVLSSMRHTRIVTEQGNYIHAEVRSPVFRFVDDIEFLIDDRVGKIHVRSASRTGYFDFGVNRKRVEEIRRRFNARLAGK